MHNRKLQVIEDVKDFFNKKERFPTSKEVQEVIGLPRRTMRRMFDDYTTLIEAALDTLDEKIFTEQRVEAVKKDIKRNKTFVITTAVVGAPVFKEALNAINNSFCKHNKAKLLVIPCADPAANVSDGLDPILLEESLVVENVDLNDNLAIYAIRLSAKQINPTTGLGRIGQRNRSFIFASPKQSLEYVPVANNKMPHALMTTGAITLPAYQTNNYMSQRTAFIADHDHIMGAIIVELVGKDRYHFRHVEFAKDGSFIDLGTKYHPNGKKSKTSILGMVLGDWHCGHTDPTVAKTTYEMIKELKPEQVILHDTFNGTSVNHHLEFRNITKSKIGITALSDELLLLRSDLEKFASMTGKVVVVASNHDYWLERYLEEGRFIKDPLNYRISLDLAIACHDGANPVEAGINLKKDKIKNLKFLKRDEDYLIKDIQCGAHGDLEAGVIRLEKSFGKSITGHCHTGGKFRRVTRVGTSTPLREDYAKGPISWTHTHAIINEDGTVQLINIIEGEWKQ